MPIFVIGLFYTYFDRISFLSNRMHSYIPQLQGHMALRSHNHTGSRSSVPNNQARKLCKQEIKYKSLD